MANHIKLHANGNRFIFNDTGNIFVPVGTAGFKTAHQESSFPIFDCRNTASYNDWFRQYAANGNNYLRIRLSHASSVGNDITRGFQSPPLDYFDIADVVPTTYTDMANPDDAGWSTKVSNSNITAMIDAAEDHGIYLAFIFFYEILLDDGRATWSRNPYKRQCAYAFDGSSCPASHMGTLDDPLDFFIPEADLIRDYSGVDDPWDERGVTRGDTITDDDDRNYITGYYQQRYLKTFIDEWGGSLNIAHWETMCEVQWLAERESTNADKLAAAELYVPWCEAVKSYIQSIDTYSRPVIHSDVRWNLLTDLIIIKEGDDTKVRKIDAATGNETEENYSAQSDYDKFLAVHNGLFYDSDAIQYHNYEKYTLDSRRDLIRIFQIGWPDKPYINGEYWSEYWEGAGTYEYTYPPYEDDRQQMWIDFICTGGVGTGNRMSGRAREDDSSDPDDFEWTELDPDWYTDFCLPLGKFMVSNGFNLSDWNTNFDDVANIDDDLGGVSFGAGQSNDNQAILMIQGATDNITLTVSNLDSGFWESRMYDYLTGNLVDTFYDSITGTLSLSLDVSDSNLDTESDGFDRDRIAIIYIKKRDVIPHTVTVVEVN